MNENYYNILRVLKLFMGFQEMIDVVESTRRSAGGRLFYSLAMKTQGCRKESTCTWSPVYFYICNLMLSVGEIMLICKGLIYLLDEFV